MPYSHVGQDLALDQVLACHLSSTKPLPEPMLTFFKSEPGE